MARRRTLVTAALAAGLVFSMAACGSNNDNSSSGSGSSSSGGGGSASGKVGVILPDTKSSARWETADRPHLRPRSRPPASSTTSRTPTATRPAMANHRRPDDRQRRHRARDRQPGQRLRRGHRAEGQVARASQTIDYDRLTLGGARRLLRLVRQHQGRRAAGPGPGQLPGKGRQANIVYLNGSPDDNNATLFAAGAHSVLDPIDQLHQGRRAGRPGLGQRSRPATIFEQMYTAAGGKIDGVLAANDGLGNAAIAILRRTSSTARSRSPVRTPPSQGLQNILAGTSA